MSNSLVDDLNKSGRFDKVYYGPSTSENDADLKLSVLVEFTLFYNVKSIEISVTLTDIANEKKVATAFVKANSEWAFPGGKMTNAISELNKQIVKFATQR